MPKGCPLCEGYDRGEPIAQARIVDDGKAMDVECARCGDFRVRGVKALQGADEPTLLRLSGFARLQSDAGGKLEVTSDNFAALAASARAPTTKGAYFDLLLQLLADRCKYPGAVTPKLKIAELAAAAFLPTEACSAALGLLQELITTTGAQGPGPAYVQCRLKPEGWRRVDELTRQAPRGDRAFVAIWFDPTLREARELGFEAALAECGFTPPFFVDDLKHQARADEPDFERHIDNRILAEIRRASLLVADATGKRASVFFEGGFAEGLGTRTIWTCKQGHEGDMAFDTRQRDHIIWRDPAHLKGQLIAWIEARGWAAKLSRG